MTNVQSPDQFLEDFLKEAANATKRIYLQSMLFEYGRVLAQLEPILIQKTKEGVDVQITVDWVSQRYSEDNPNIIPPFWGKNRRRMIHLHEQTRQLHRRLEKAGIAITFTNHPTGFARILSVFRRNHKKLYIIDEAAWVGGINFFDPSWQTIDFMVKFTDPHFVQILTKEFFKVNQRQSNYRILLNSHYELLVDSGLVGKSLIYDEATGLIQGAQQSVVFVSQFVPDGKLLHALVDASKRGAHITVITSHTTYKYFVNFPYNITYHRFRSKTKNTNIVLSHQDRTAHAKLIIIDGTTAIFGSHNFVHTGGMLGTEEIAIRTEDKELVNQLEEFIKTETKITSPI